jgi:hypothetical protein
MVAAVDVLADNAGTCLVSPETTALGRQTLSRTTTGRVRVSARFDDLRDAPAAFDVAKVTLRSHTHSASPVSVFDGSILATAAVSAPGAMVKSARTMLDGLENLAEEARDLLFETFRVWQESDASVRHRGNADSICEERGDLHDQLVKAVREWHSYPQPADDAQHLAAWRCRFDHLGAHRPSLLEATLAGVRALTCAATELGGLGVRMSSLHTSPISNKATMIANDHR